MEDYFRTTGMGFRDRLKLIFQKLTDFFKTESDPNLAIESIQNEIEENQSLEKNDVVHCNESITNEETSKIDPHTHCTVPDLNLLETHLGIFMDHVYPNCHPRIAENIGLSKGSTPILNCNLVDDDGDAVVYNPKIAGIVHIDVDLPIHNKNAQYCTYEFMKCTLYGDADAKMNYGSDDFFIGNYYEYVYYPLEYLVSEMVRRTSDYSYMAFFLGEFVK